MPRSRPETWFSTSCRTWSSGNPRALATRGTWNSAPAGVMSGSSPLADVVTRSDGIGVLGFSFASFSAWQSGTGEDKGSVVQNPGFANPAYPNDDYSLAESPGVGFVIFDSNLAGRSNPVIPSPTIQPTFPIAPFNPATDF